MSYGKIEVPNFEKDNDESRLPRGWFVKNYGNRCPKCKKEELTRIHRPFFMKLIPWPKFRRYRCGHCNKSCYQLKKP
jgi:hypothetical protein